MANLIALDWDTHELRAIIARSSGSSITVTDAALVKIADDSPATLTAAIKKLLEDRGIANSKTKALVTIGRGKSELRQLNLPPVPENELPDMVRLQAMQTFAAVGDNTVVDFLQLPSGDETTSVLAAAVAPATMSSVESIIKATGIELARVALRPVAAAALYQIGTTSNLDDSSIVGDVVLVDLLADDAEIVVMRGRRVMFVRSVRMPQESVDRPNQIAGELRRSLMACGINASSASQKVVIWGTAATHEAERIKLAESLGCRVSTLDPMSLVETDSRRARDPEVQTHTGRFAPLIGLLIADAKSNSVYGSPYLVDFLNPRKSVEVKKDNRKAIAIGAAIAATLLFVAFSAWSSLRAKDQVIKEKELELSSLKPKVNDAQASIDRTEIVDKFLDGNVIWIDELSRIAKRIPPSTDAILKSVSATSPPREGGGKIALQGAATSPVVVDQLAVALRDDRHSVAGTGASDLGDREANQDYRWGFRETVTIDATSIREDRYAALSALRDQEVAAPDSPPEPAVPPEPMSPSETVLPIEPIDEIEPRESSEQPIGGDQA
jgi:hypothetical protein